MNDPSSIEHLSYSQISSFLRCPRQWSEEKLNGNRGKPSSALVRGTVVDRVSTYNWKTKRTAKDGKDLTEMEARELAEDTFTEYVTELGGREAVDWGSESYARTMNSTGYLAALHVRDHAKLITPKGVQVRLEKPIPGTKRTLLGFIDAVADDEWLVDVKTGGRRMPQGDADTDTQASAYAWLVGYPVKFSYFRVIDTGKNQFSEVVNTTRSKAAIEMFEEKAYGVSKLIDVGVYPTNPGWQCRWCPIKSSCVDAITQ